MLCTSAHSSTPHYGGGRRPQTGGRPLPGLVHELRVTDALMVCGDYCGNSLGFYHFWGNGDGIMQQCNHDLLITR